MQNHARAARATNPAIPTPTPIPAFAPVLKPLEFAVCVGLAVDAAAEFADDEDGGVGVGVAVELMSVEEEVDWGAGGGAVLKRFKRLQLN